MGILDLVKPGVVTGTETRKIFDYAKKHGFAIPAINCSSSSTVNAALEAARDIKSPIIIQFSHGGSAYFAGKSLSNKDDKASILGAVAGAKYIHQVAPAYGIPVIIHSDHCAEELLPWFDGMLEADEDYYLAHNKPLFSSHMLDLSKLNNNKNIEICLKYLKRMAKLDILLEMEIGITGGEEDGVNNESANKSDLYTKPQDIWLIYKAFSEVTNLFTIAAAFGNVHGVYSPGNVVLSPGLLADHQKKVREELQSDEEKPVLFVFHGGSGSSSEDIAIAVKNGVVKMNVDTDTQWAYWVGFKDYYEKKKDYLQKQVGNPEGPDKPNKKHYDPRAFVREGEKSMAQRVKEACTSLGNVNTL